MLTMDNTSNRSNWLNWSSLTTIVVLFVLMRLTILFLFTPQGLLNAYSDYYYYFRTAQLSDQGYYPFVNMWYEYPPLLAYLPLVIYRLTQAIVPVGDVYSFSYQLFARLLGMVYLVFETGVLILLCKTASTVWGRTKAEWLGWVYSGLSLPLFFWLYAHQVVVVFFMMLAIYWFITKKLWSSALALGLGVASKLVPIFLLPAFVKFLWPQVRTIVIFCLLVVLVFGIQYLPFFYLDGASWVAASFRAIFNVGSYSTVYAILDGNWGPGNYGPLSTRIDIHQAVVSHTNPSVLPGWVILAVFALAYLFFYVRPVEVNNPQHFIWFSTLTWIFFHLYLKGWSPQWAVAFIPLILLSFPDHLGLILSLLLTTFVFIEWPLNALIDAKPLTVMIIILRTGLLVALFIQLARRLWSPINRAVVMENLKNG
jgi:hypothetical protein